MKINENADLTILLKHGWNNWNNHYRNCYYKILKGNGFAEISLVINPIGPDSDFIINSIVDHSDGYDESNMDMFEILQEIELLNKLDILI